MPLMDASTGTRLTRTPIRPEVSDLRARAAQIRPPAITPRFHSTPAELLRIAENAFSTALDAGWKPADLEAPFTALDELPSREPIRVGKIPKADRTHVYDFAF